MPLGQQQPVVARMLDEPSAGLHQPLLQAGQRPGYSGASGAVNPSRNDDATLQQTAKAYVKVQQIVREANQDLSKTNDNAQQQEIAKQAESRKMAAVKAEGLQPQQYNQVLQLARNDKAFEQKFLSYVAISPVLH